MVAAAMSDASVPDSKKQYLIKVWTTGNAYLMWTGSINITTIYKICLVTTELILMQYFTGIASENTKTFLNQQRIPNQKNLTFETFRNTGVV